MEARRTAGRAFQSTSPEATVALGRALGAGLFPGAVVALVGELGGGKTTLVRGLAAGLGVRDAVTSPSFTLMHEYEGPVPLFHFDAWMAGRETGFLEDGGADYLGGDGVAVVEWADRIEALLPRPYLRVTLAHRSPAERRLELAVLPAAPGAGPRELEAQAALEALLAALEPLPGLSAVSPVSEAGPDG